MSSSEVHDRRRAQDYVCTQGRIQDPGPPLKSETWDFLFFPVQIKKKIFFGPRKSDLGPSPERFIVLAVEESPDDAALLEIALTSPDRTVHIVDGVLAA